MEDINKEKKINRRGFINTAAAVAMSIGLVSITGSCKNESESTSTSKNKSRGRKKSGRNVRRISIIDVHRHCLPVPTSMAEGVARFMLEQRTHWRKSAGLTITTIDGITSIIYPELMDIDMQIRGQDEACISKSILSFSLALESMVKALFLFPEGQITKRLNDSTFRMVARYPDKLDFMATVNPFHGSCINECKRCIDELGAKGIGISTSWDGSFLDSPDLNSFWEFAQQRNIAIFLHPPQVPIGYEYMNIYKLEEMVGRPFDTSISVSRMIYSGVFDRYPNLNIVIPHMGGGLPMIVGRLDFGYRLGYSALPSGQEAVCKRKPSDYFRTNLYVDTMGFAPSGIRHTIDLFGADRVLFGSDYAAVPINPKEHVDMVKEIGLSHLEQEKVLWKNAARLFNIS